MGQQARFQPSNRHHAPENQGPDAHDAPAHFIRDAGLNERVGGREVEQHAPSGHGHADQHQRVGTDESQQDKHGGEQP